MIWITIDKKINIPIIQQIYSQIRDAILSGKLKEGNRLPSTRVVAQELNVSRNVVIEAYDQLVSEGYIQGHKGSGTYITEDLQIDILKESSSPQKQIPSKDQEASIKINFRSGIPALDYFPHNRWGHIYKSICSEIETKDLGYSETIGHPRLRKTLADYLQQMRKVKCHENQIIITNGAVQALSIIAQVLLKEGDRFIIEDPTNIDIRKSFERRGAIGMPIPVDEQGLKTGLLPQELHPKLILVTPSHQFPLGGVMPIARRLELIQYAKQKNCYIIEDDYDSEYRYEGYPIPSIQGLAPENVIYIGTFSKILSPALRIGYLILPEKLVDSCSKEKHIVDLHTETLTQLALERFIEEGQLLKHIRKMKKIYKRRQNLLIHELKSNFPHIKIMGESTGMHLVAQWRDKTFTKEDLDKLRSEGLNIHCVCEYTVGRDQHLNQLIFGYGNVEEKMITEGISVLKRIIQG
ncbi:MocR-like pyridoxine biosynthesis transcription factor PdxR [Alkaliphilus peptidifermentans]|uniref:Transcriptional regulator, GntR family n=1 Tax=Alkaliphilus peptidifermentans DSM 18978 TaxID=1120976 RepID=A0A1G5G3S2_9FIRM|nr:PLP-dependent aminotransferase family protein [Alkaliphilus peptidifermentans]SCY45989.1 transcriptional regulator, GntR family [Alkaliphilus peptidifermentans DSM 18978]